MIDPPDNFTVLCVQLMITYYRPQRSWGKVIFSGVCVKNSVHRSGVVSQHALQVSRPIPSGEVEGSGPRGSPGPHPGGSWGVRPGGSPGPHLGGVSRPTPRGFPGTHPVGGGIPACTEADTPPQQMATAVGSTHPSGMHSCSYRIPFDSQLQILQAWVLTTRWLKLTLVVVLYQGLACNAFEGYSWDLRWNRPFVLKFSCLVHLWCYICFTFDLNLLKIRLK